MIEIPVRICGDHWLNPGEVEQKLLESDLEQTVYLDICAEGPSLHALGVLDMVQRHCDQSGRNRISVFIKNWSNPIEETEFHHRTVRHYSHFFWHSDRYWIEPAGSTHEKLIGCFIGRKTIPRMVILHDLYQHRSQHCLFSVMSTRVPLPWTRLEFGINLENLESWLPAEQIRPFQDWWQQCPIKSIDGHDVRDQYLSDRNTNLDILSHYHKFDIELVIETYTRGCAFFPTEKTVRPMVAQKPMLIYGPRHFLKHLQDLGFQTWHSVWDESYDELEGPNRWNKMRTVIDTVCSLPQQELLSACQPITEHNRTVLQNLVTRARPR